MQEGDENGCGVLLIICAWVELPICFTGTPVGCMLPPARALDTPLS